MGIQNNPRDDIEKAKELCRIPGVSVFFIPTWIVDEIKTYEYHPDGKKIRRESPLTDEDLLDVLSFRAGIDIKRIIKT